MKSSIDGNAASAPPPPSPVKSGDLKARILSALVMAPVVLAAVWFGGWIFHLLIVVGAVLGMLEWVNLVPSQRKAGAVAVSVIGIAAVMASEILWGPALAIAIAVASVILLAAAGGGRDKALLGAGIFYVGAGLVGLMWLRDRPEIGLELFLYAMLAVWATDIGAYAAGRTIGGPKLAPRISPKKTWAGLIGGMVSAGLVGWLVALVSGAALPLLALLVGALAAVVGQAGDLFESAVKRRYDVKDSGHLIPGHGGILDRIDGLLVAAPVLALFHATVGSAVSWW